MTEQTAVALYCPPANAHDEISHQGKLWLLQVELEDGIITLCPKGIDEVNLSSEVGPVYQQV